MNVGIAIAIAAVLVVGLVLVSYNRLVSLSKRAEGAWSDIDVQLKRRWDLIPSLVSAVQGYARHENETLRQTVEARDRAARSAGVAQRGSDEQGLASAVTRLFAVAEAYPDLKASQNFADLHRALIDVENHLQSARRYYNAVVRDYNTAVQSFPTLLIAGPLGFTPREFFQLDSDAERATPQVQLG
jgi:LemA protein